jgi:hypothetical protein
VSHDVPAILPGFSLQRVARDGRAIRRARGPAGWPSRPAVGEGTSRLGVSPLAGEGTGRGAAPLSSLLSVYTMICAIRAPVPLWCRPGRNGPTAAGLSEAAWLTGLGVMVLARRAWGRGGPDAARADAPRRPHRRAGPMLRETGATRWNRARARQARRTARHGGHGRGSGGGTRIHGYDIHVSFQEYDIGVS